MGCKIRFHFLVEARIFLLVIHHMQTDNRAHSHSHPWKLEATSLREQRPECEVNQSPTSSTEVNNLHYLYFYYSPPCLWVMFFWLVSALHFCFDPNHKWIIANKIGGRITRCKQSCKNELSSQFFPCT